MIYSNIGTNVLGHMTIAGHDATELVKGYGDALMVLDENAVRQNCNVYTSSMKKYFPNGSMPVYASKALCFKGFYPILDSEGFGADAVSPGEIYTIKAAGFDMEKVYFHGNNKTDTDLEFAINSNVGYIVVDSLSELLTLDGIAGNIGAVQKILLRLAPGIDPHTHAKISTGGIDTKFGIAIATGQALAVVKVALSLKNIKLCGFHCHIGSQIFECEPFCDAADIMLGFIKEVKSAFDYETEILNLGGGFGVRYVESDPEISIKKNLEVLGTHIKNVCASLGICEPKIVLEPGRSIVANACTTLYEAGNIKVIPEIKNYVSVNGGMTDNPRYTLYGSKYTVVNASKANEACDFKCTLAGRCCESGDILQEDILIAKPEKGDIIAVLGTGAYNYSMASNYNRICRPALIIVKGDDVRIGIRRETFEDLVKYDA